MSSRDGNLMFSDEVLECPKRGEAEAGLPLENWAMRIIVLKCPSA
jgi:hypothetical protein